MAGSRPPLAAGEKGPLSRRSAAAPSAAVPDSSNRFLEHLPRSVLARLAPHLEQVYLERGQVLFHRHAGLQTVHFPGTALISLLASLESGQTLEVGLVGRDGLAGISVFPWVTTMPCDGVVQIPGTAQRISADVLRRELMASESLYLSVCRYAQAMHVRCMHMAVCNMFHPVEQRCVRWLLTASDLLGSADVPLTHDSVATMLGVHRPTVTVVLRALHRKGLIDERRGRIVIRDRDGLERACCECHAAMCSEERRLLGY